jgi:nucleoid-associated protein YgaU
MRTRNQVGRFRFSAVVLVLASLLPAAAQCAQRATEIELAEARAQLHNLRQRLDRWMVAADERESEVTAELDRRESRIGTLEKELAEIRTRQTEDQAELVQLRESSSEQGQALTEAQVTLVDAVNRLELVTTRADACDIQLSAAQRRVALQSARIEKLAASPESDGGNEAAEQTRVELESCSAQLAREHTLTEAQQQRLKSLSTQIARLRRTAQANRVSLQTANTLLKRTQAEVRAEERRARSATASLFETKQQLSESAAELGQARRGALPGSATTLAEATARAKSAGLRYRQSARAALTNGANADRLRKTAAKDRDRLFMEQTRLAQLMSAKGVYTVRQNDTLSQISRIFNGNPSTWPEIFGANRHLLEQADTVLPGLVLVIP